MSIAYHGINNYTSVCIHIFKKDTKQKKWESWYIAVTPALWKQRPEFKANLGYITKPPVLNKQHKNHSHNKAATVEFSLA